MSRSFTGKILLCGALVFFLARVSCAEEGTAGPERLFSRGNDCYEKAEYQNAVTEYNKIIDTGYASGPLYYNLADAYFKMGKLGEAVLNYERAMLIMPRDGDLKANYKFARSKVIERPVPAKSLWDWRPFKLYRENLTVNEATMLASAAYVLALVLLFLVLSRIMMNWYLSVLLACLFLFTVFNVAVVWKKTDEIKTGAVTVVPKADAFFGPFDTATKFFALNEGVYVNVMKWKGDWVKVKRADGKIGWVKANEIEKIQK